jgi:hypothetical protein
MLQHLKRSSLQPNPHVRPFHSIELVYALQEIKPVGFFRLWRGLLALEVSREGSLAPEVSAFVSGSASLPQLRVPCLTLNVILWAHRFASKEKSDLCTHRHSRYLLLQLRLLLYNEDTVIHCGLRP